MAFRLCHDFSHASTCSHLICFLFFSWFQYHFTSASQYAAFASAQLPPKELFLLHRSRSRYVKIHCWDAPSMDTIEVRNCLDVTVPPLLQIVLLFRTLRMLRSSNLVRYNKGKNMCPFHKTPQTRKMCAIVADIGASSPILQTGRQFFIAISCVKKEEDQSDPRFKRRRRLYYM